MSKFNQGTITATPASSPVTSTSSEPDAHTFEGGAGFTRDPKSELFLLAVSAMATETRFYERRSPQLTSHDHVRIARDSSRLTSIPWRQETSAEKRFRELTRTIATEDLDWLTGFTGWLRRDAFIRTGSVLVAAETLHTRYAAGLRPYGRAIIPAALDRADEPGELLGYWLERYGRRFPHALTRGLADVVTRLYTEWSILKYDSRSKPIRFADVIELCQPRYNHHLYDTPQDALFRYCIERRHNRHTKPPKDARMLRAHAELMSIPVEDRRAVLKDPVTAARRVAECGLTWEALSGWLQGEMDASAWTAIIPNMGVEALLKNLRNFDQAGVSDDTAARVAAVLANPEAVIRSRLFPMQFLTAQRAMISQRWGHTLDKALDLSISNIPRLPGKTLILVDTSTSMNNLFSADGTMCRWDAAALFGIAVARACDDADVVSFSSTAKFWGDPHNTKTKVFPLVREESLLMSLNRWKTGGYFLGGGTCTAGAIRAHYKQGAHTRVVILTDEQADHDGTEVSSSVPAAVPLYTWNLAGYQYGHAPAGTRNRHTFGGLSDAAFKLMPLIEAGRDARWDDLFQPAASRAGRIAK